MTSFDEYCPLCEGGLLASGGLLAGGGPLAGGGYACARADSVPQGTRARTKRVVRIIVCIACSIRGRAVERSPTKLCGFNIWPSARTRCRVQASHWQRSRLGAKFP